MSILCVVLMLIGGCASGPGKYLVVNEQTFPQEVDKVWSTVVQFFSENNVPVKTMEKASGFISAESQYVPGSWVDCGKPNFLITQRDPVGTFNVFVKTDNSGVSVTVNSQFWCTRTFENTSEQHQCVTTGVMDAALLDYVDLNSQ